MFLKFPVFIFLCFCGVGGVFSASIRNEEGNDYEGYMVIQIEPLTETQHDFVINFLDNYHGEVDIWKSLELEFKNKTWTLVLVPPHLITLSEAILNSNQISYKILIKNLKEIIQNERHLQQNYTKTGKISFDHYYRHGEINDYLDHLGEQYPDLVTVFSIGKSYEGRDLKMIKISTGGEGEKPAIFIDGGIHAREWIAPAQVTYIINQLVENFEENKGLVANVDWYLIPVVNPDGYEFSHEKDRLWRRTRSKNVLSYLPKCVGVDANRNWDIYWSGYVTAKRQVTYGHIPCIDDYAGPEAFSEVEVKNLAEFAKTISKKIKLYITFHSHGSKILYPWGYTDTLPENAEELTTVGNMVKDSLMESYVVGSSANALYFLTGSSKDYFKDILGVDLSYTVELPAGGTSGFDLPPKKILGVVKDMFNGVRTWAQYIEEKFYYLRH